MIARFSPLSGLACLGVLMAACGCQSTGPDHLPRESERVDILSLMLPAEIKIQPFTKIRSFDDDDVPDGIVAVVRPVDRFGDPVKAAGFFYFELWSYQGASGDPKGQRLEFWDKTLTSADDIRLYWTRAQMYEFQLAWTQGAGAIRPDAKYVLTVTYRSPMDITYRDEYVLTFHLGGGPLSGTGATMVPADSSSGR